MRFLEKLKRDLSKHRGKAAVMGVLFVVLIVMSIKAVLALQPQPLAAAGMPSHLSTPAEARAPQPQGNDDITPSKGLWSQLQYVNPNGLPADVAFTFDETIYPLDPAHRTLELPEAAEPKGVVPLAPAPDNIEILRHRKLEAIREQSRNLIVKSISLGKEPAKSMAIINQQLLTVGQEILGFQITAIREREVELKKDGETIVVRMFDEPRGP